MGMRISVLNHKKTLPQRTQRFLFCLSTTHHLIENTEITEPTYLPTNQKGALPGIDKVQPISKKVIARREAMKQSQ